MAVGLKFRRRIAVHRLARRRTKIIFVPRTQRLCVRIKLFIHDGSWWLFQITWTSVQGVRRRLLVGEDLNPGIKTPYKPSNVSSPTVFATEPAPAMRGASER